MSWLENHWAEVVALPPIKSKRAACAVASCDRVSQALGLCTGHYLAARRRFDPEWAARGGRDGGPQEQPAVDAGGGLP